jgi:hypothetical protein
LDNKNFQKSPSMSDIVRMSNDKKAKNKISSLQRIQKIKEKVEQIKNLQIIEFLQYVGELEIELEQHKKKLVNDAADYNTIDAFRMIDL